MGINGRGRTLAVFMVVLTFLGVAAGMAAFAIALTLYPGLGQGALALNSYQVTGDIAYSSIVASLNNTGGGALVISHVSVIGVNYTHDPVALGVPPLSGYWGFVVDGANATGIGAGKTGILSLNSSGRIDPIQVLQVSVVCQDGTSIYFNVTKT